MNTPFVNTFSKERIKKLKKFLKRTSSYGSKVNNVIASQAVESFNAFKSHFAQKSLKFATSTKIRFKIASLFWNDQMPIVIFLSMQGKSPTVIEKEMEDTLGEIVVKYSTITRYLRQTKFPPSSDKPENDEYLNVLDKVDQIILDVLDEQPFASLMQIAQRAGIPKSTVHYHLIVILNFKNMNLKWVPHSLTDEQNAKRTLVSKQLLKTLRSAKHHSWNYFLTGDESWFYLSYEHERM